MSRSVKLLGTDLDGTLLRSDGTVSDRTRLALLREAAQLRLEHKHDSAGALADLARAFPLAPRDQLIEHQIVSLAKTTGDWATGYTGPFEADLDVTSFTVNYNTAQNALVNHWNSWITEDDFAQIAGA